MSHRCKCAQLWQTRPAFPPGTSIKHSERLLCVLSDGLRQPHLITMESLAARPSRRQIAQQAHRQREAAEQESHRESHRWACRALQPYNAETMTQSVGECDIPCVKCGALHWLDERVTGRAPGNEFSTVRDPRFSLCCSNGGVVLPATLDPPPELRALLTDQSNGGSSQTCGHGG